MSGAIATAIVGGIATAVVSSIFAPSRPSTSTPAPAPVTPPPAATQQPDQAIMRRQTVAAGDASGLPSGTLLTGPGGVDSEKVKLGKNTALGA